jgi:hypothetical protein
MEPLLILQGVREIALSVSPEWPGEITQRAFDIERAKSTKYRVLPNARRITEALDLPWRTVLEIAQEPEGKHAYLLGAKKKASPEKEGLDEDYVVFLLKWVARRLNSRTLTRGQYQAERQKLLAEDRKHYLHGRQLFLPNAEQIETGIEWKAALVLAELDVDARPEQQIRQKIPTRIELIERYYNHYKVQPTKDDIKVFAHANKVPCGEEGGRKWSESMRDWKQERERKGLPVPDGPLPRAERPDCSLDIGAALPDEYRHRGKWLNNPDHLVEWIKRYLEDLKPGERSTQRGYATWARTQPEAPTASTFIRCGGWGSIRQQAQEKLLKEAAGNR